MEIKALEPKCLTIFHLGYFRDIADAEDKPISLTLAFQRRVPLRRRFTPGATFKMFLLHAYRKQQVTMKEVGNQKLRPPWPRRAMECRDDSADVQCRPSALRKPNLELAFSEQGKYDFLKVSWRKSRVI